MPLACSDGCSRESQEGGSTPAQPWRAPQGDTMEYTRLEGQPPAPEKGGGSALPSPEDSPLIARELVPPRGGSSFFQSLVNGVNVLAGIGILSTPFATAGAGWLGLLLLLLFAFACCYTGLLLQACMDSRPGIHSYPDVGEAAYGRGGRWLTAVLLYAELYAVAVDLLILEADNLSTLFPHASATVFGVLIPPQRLFLLLSAAVVLPTVWLRDLSLLAYVSTTGVVSTLLVVLGVVWVGAVDGVGFTHEGQLLRLSGLPAAAGLFGFCFSGHAVLPNIYRSMKNPSQFVPVMVTSFLVCLAMYGGMAVAGYMMFGDDLKEQVTLNLPPGLVATNVVIWTTVLTPFTKYALTVTPLAMCLEECVGVYSYTDPSWTTFIKSTCLRTALVVSGVVVAAAVPFFGLVVAFTGSFLSLSISVVLPCIFAYRLLPSGRTWTHPALMLSVLVLGLVSAVAGTYYSIRGIAHKFHV